MNPFFSLVLHPISFTQTEGDSEWDAEGARLVLGTSYRESATEGARLMLGTSDREVDTEGWQVVLS